MTKFVGEPEEFKAAVQSAGKKGEWSEESNKLTFRAKTGEIVHLFTSTGTVQFQGVKNADFANAVVAACESSDMVLAKPVEAKVSEEKRVFIVHGHDKVARQQLELLLYKLELKPFVLQDEDGESNTIIEALEKRIYQGSSFGIVLMTPDDFGYPKTKTDDERQARARQNVILEMGMVMAALGRSNMAILKKGNLEMPSDCDGILRLEFNEDVEEVKEKLLARLKAAGVVAS